MIVYLKNVWFYLKKFYTLHCEIHDPPVIDRVFDIPQFQQLSS